MYLGIDLGTSGVKAVLLDAHHQLLASADAALSLQTPQPSWSEQAPADWWQAVELAVAELRARQPSAWAQVRAIGLSGQMHGAVVLDAQMQCLRPAILWNDGRASAECAELEQRVPSLRAITGNQAMPGFTAPKLLWLQRHEPELFARIAKVLLPKDWLRWQIGGHCASDMSDASGTLWLDVQRRSWSEPLLQACGLGLHHMPELVEGAAASGRIRPELALRWGLSPDVLLAGGGGDNAASAIGVGAARAGQGFVSLGTSGVIFLVGEHYRSAPEQGVHSFAHALPGTWHQMSVMLSAASAFAWVTQLTQSSSEAALSAQVQALSPAQQAAAPLFLPYLSGERTPHNDPQASGVFIGLRSTHGPAELAYAVMEGVTFGLMDGWQAMGQSPSSHTTLSLVGGGARSPAWAQLIASGLGCQLSVPAGAHAAGAIGAARLAWLASADGASPLDEVCQPLPTTAHYQPQAAQQALLAPRYAHHTQLYPSLKPHFAAMAG